MVVGRWQFKHRPDERMRRAGMQRLLAFLWLVRQAEQAINFFFLNDTAPTEISPFPLPDALPILSTVRRYPPSPPVISAMPFRGGRSLRSRETYACTMFRDVAGGCAPHSTSMISSCRTTRFGCRDRKSTRLNSSHSQISYAVFCLK